MDSQEPSGQEVVDFIRAAFRLEQLRQDIAMLFEVVSNLPQHLDLATRLCLLWEARGALARAVKEERRTTAEQASLTPRVMRYAIAAENVAQAPKPAPPPSPPPAPVAPPAEERPVAGPRRSFSGRPRPSFRVAPSMNERPERPERPERLERFQREEPSNSSFGSISSAIDRIFQAEIQSNVSGIGSFREAAAEVHSEPPAPPASPDPGEGGDADPSSAGDLGPEASAQTPVGQEPADVSKTKIGG
jgi:hypothetical protein